MKLVTDRTGQISHYIRPYMEERFQESCRVIQVKMDGHAGEIWGELNSAIENSLSMADFLQKRHMKGSLQYFIFSFLRHGGYLNGPALQVEALDDGFYLDEQAAAGYYCPGFLRERYWEDLDFLYQKAAGKFVRLQNYELDAIRNEYTRFYYSILFQMMKSLAGPVMETVADSGLPITEGFKLVFGEYMDKGRVLCHPAGQYKARSNKQFHGTAGAGGMAMKYFLIETDEKNKLPYGINKNRAIDIRLLTKAGFDRLPLWNVVEMVFPREGFFPDLICSPFTLLSDICMETVVMYQPDTPYKVVKLWDRDNGVNATYFFAAPDELDCMSDKTRFNSVGNRVVKLVLDREKLGKRAVFKVKGFASNNIVGRMDFVESILRRDARGIRLTEIEVG